MDRKIFHESKRNLTTKRLTLNHNGDSYSEFISKNEEQIYTGIVEVFKMFTQTKKRKIILHIESDARIVNIDIKLVFTNKDFKILSDKVLPFFEGIENYDVCVEIRELIKKFNGFSC
jgi:hypothetical protein